MASPAPRERPISPQIEHSASRTVIDRGSGWTLDALEDLIADVEITIDEQEEGDPEDVESLKVARDPKLPPKTEVEAHRTGGHTPFRSWCKFSIWFWFDIAVRNFAALMV